MQKFKKFAHVPSENRARRNRAPEPPASHNFVYTGPDSQRPLNVDPSRPLCTNSNHRLSDNARAMKSRRYVARIPEVDCPRLAMKFESSSGNRVCLGKATTTASSSADRTVDLGSFGPYRHIRDRGPPFPLGDRLLIDSVALRQRPRARLTMLYRSTERPCRRGAPMKNLAQSASFESLDKNAPSKVGTKHRDIGPANGPKSGSTEKVKADSGVHNFLSPLALIDGKGAPA
jgi:hypothetical protein